MWLLVAFACSDPPPPPPAAPPDACTVMRTPAAGPRQEAIAAALDRPLDVARLRIEEARLTSDPGFYTLAEEAIDCALSRDPGDTEGLRLRAHVLLQFHQFAAAEAVARPLYEQTRNHQDAMLLGDALMEQGRLDEAGGYYQAAMDSRPGLPIYDRAAWLRWLYGDLAGALQLQTWAVQAGSPSDPEPLAWVLTRLGWLHALSGAPAPEIDAALRLLPGYKPALLARGRVRLHAGEAGAADDLRAAGATVEAVWALSELDPTASVEAVGLQDPRGFAMWLTDRGRPEDLVRALALLEDELAARQDAVTRMAHAWALHRAGRDAAEEARAALATGNVEPRLLLQGGLLLNDPALLRRALAMGPGLLPTERQRAEAALTPRP